MNKKQLLGIATMAFILLLFASSALFQDTFFRLVGRLDLYASAHPLLGALAFVLLAGASVLLSPFSSIPLVPAAVIIWGAEQTFILLLVGWLLGGIVSYGIGYYVGYPAVRRFVSKQHMNEWIEALSERVDIWIAFLFRLSTPSETGYVFGTLKYDLCKYIAITFLAELPFAYLAVYASEAFINDGWIAFVVLGCIWILSISLAVRALNKRIKK